MLDVYANALWPTCVRSMVDIDIACPDDKASLTSRDNLHDNAHPLVALIWYAIVLPILTTSQKLYYDRGTTSLWLVSAYLEHAFCKLPLNKYDRRIILSTPEFHDMRANGTLTSKQLMYEWRLFLHNAPPRILVTPKGRLRKRTAHNIINYTTFTKAVHCAGTAGISITTLRGETSSVDRYMERMVACRQAFEASGRLFSMHNLEPLHLEPHKVAILRKACDERLSRVK